MKYLILLALLLSGCPTTADLKAQCAQVADDERMQLEKDILSKAALFQALVDQGVIDRLTQLGCYPVDGSSGWSCVGALVCQ